MDETKNHSGPTNTQEMAAQKQAQGGYLKPAEPVPVVGPDGKPTSPDHPVPTAAVPTGAAAVGVKTPVPAAPVPPAVKK